jgi:hypothetical protein
MVVVVLHGGLGLVVGGVEVVAVFLGEFLVLQCHFAEAALNDYFEPDFRLEMKLRLA